MIGIYKIESPTGGVYIGKSINILARWAEHKKPGEVCNNLLKRSFNKYGIKSHSFIIIHELPNDVSIEVLNAYEIFYITQFRICGIKMLNITNGGTGGITRLGMKNSDKQKAAASLSGKKRRLSPEYQSRMLARRMGKITLPRDENGKPVFTKELKDKISVTKKLALSNDENKKNILIEKCLMMSANNIGKTGDKNKKSIKIEQLDLSGNLIAIHTGTREAERLTGVERKSIYVSCKDSSKTAGGYKWRHHKNL